MPHFSIFNKINAQPYLILVFSIERTPAVLFLGLSKKINAQPYLGLAFLIQPYLILAFLLIKWISSSTKFWPFQWNKSLALLCFSIFNEVNPQPYLILSFKMKWRPSHTLFWPFEGNKSWALPYFSIFNEINPESHLFSIVLTK